MGTRRGDQKREYRAGAGAENRNQPVASGRLQQVRLQSRAGAANEQPRTSDALSQDQMLLSRVLTKIYMFSEGLQIGVEDERRVKISKPVSISDGEKVLLCAN